MDNSLKHFFSNLRSQISNIVNLNDHIDTDKASQYIRSNIDIEGPNAYILAFAIVVASVGLNTNSIPVIIGAMLISPLMGPIFGIGYGLGTNDTSFLKKAFTFWYPPWNLRTPLSSWPAQIQPFMTSS